MDDGAFKLWSWGRMEIIVAAVAVLLTMIVLSQFVAVRQSRSYRLPPGPKGLPLLGSLLDVGQLLHRSFYEMSKTYGPVMYLHLGTIPALVISNGEMAKELLQTNDRFSASRPQQLIPAYITYGAKDVVFSPYGPYWRSIRKVVNLKLLTTSKLVKFTKTLEGEILNTVHTMLEQTQSGGKDAVNVTNVLNGMTMNIMTLMLWNKRQRNIDRSLSKKDEKLGKLMHEVVELIAANNIADFLPSFLQPFMMRLSGLERRVRNVHEELEDYCETIICEREQALSKETKMAADEDDFLNVLLKLMNQPEDSEAISRETIKAVILDIIVAGTDTSSISIDWILAELLRHPDIMKKVQDELTRVVGDDRLVSESDIPNLKYLNAVVKEGLRHRSAAPAGVPHYTMADCKIGGYDMPANTTIFINVFAIHHDATVWENPWEFNPDRFLDSEKDFKGHDYDFLPFGGGRRICPGLNLASTIMHLAIAQLLHAVKWSLPKGQAMEDIDMTEIAGLSTARSTPLVLSAKPRLAHHIIYPVMI